MADLPRFLSPTGAGTFEQCPRRWRHRYVDRLPDPPGEPALVGTFAHRVLELLCEEPAAERSEDRSRSLARKAWPSFATHPDFTALGLDEDAQRAFRWRAWTAIAALWGLEDPATVVVRATEQRVSTTLAGVPFRGVVDRLDVADDGLVVTDYKTGSAPRADRAGRALSQVLLYAAAVEADTGERPVRARLLYLGERSSVVETPVDDGTLGGATGGLAATWSSLTAACAADDFAPRSGPLCGWCPYVGICEEGEREVRQRAAADRLRHDAPARALLGIDA